jgi:hypothetical protein
MHWFDFVLPFAPHGVAGWLFMFGMPLVLLGCLYSAVRKFRWRGFFLVCSILVWGGGVLVFVVMDAGLVGLLVANGAR